jgi:RNA polymerase sigma-70 factor (ECF subfamily)
MTTSNVGRHIDDERAFGELVQRHRDGLQLLCVLMLGDPTRAENAMQEAVLVAWRQRARARGSPSTRIWLYRITVRVCSDALQLPETSLDPDDR